MFLAAAIALALTATFYAATLGGLVLLWSAALDLLFPDQPSGCCCSRSW